MVLHIPASISGIFGGLCGIGWYYVSSTLAELIDALIESAVDYFARKKRAREFCKNARRVQEIIDKEKQYAASNRT
jgi:hypothetical protein